MSQIKKSKKQLKNNNYENKCYQKYRDYDRGSRSCH